MGMGGTKSFVRGSERSPGKDRNLAGKFSYLPPSLPQKEKPSGK